MDASTQEEIGRLFGFQITEDMRTYLGISLFHTRAKKSTFHFVMDKVQKKINTFDAKLLSLVGRIMLAKSVLLTIPGFFMQIVMVLVGVCAQIEQVVQRFI